VLLPESTRKWARLARGGSVPYPARGRSRSCPSDHGAHPHLADAHGTTRSPDAQRPPAEGRGSSRPMTRRVRFAHGPPGGSIECRREPGGLTKAPKPHGLPGKPGVRFELIPQCRSNAVPSQRRPRDRTAAEGMDPAQLLLDSYKAFPVP
jgi:hypothetical protein